MGKKIIRAEDNVTISNRKVKVFACKTCGREHGYYGHDDLAKRQAMTCHGNDFACCNEGCSGRSHYCGGACQGCDDVNRAARWEKYPIRDVAEGVDPFPLATLHGDDYFFDEDALLDHCVEQDVLPSEMLLVHARPVTSRTFDLSEFLEDDLPDDGDTDLPLDRSRIEEINAAVNAAIKECGTLSYRPGSERPHPDLVNKWDERALMLDLQLSGTDDGPDEPAEGGDS